MEIYGPTCRSIGNNCENKNKYIGFVLVEKQNICQMFVAIYWAPNNLFGKPAHGTSLRVAPAFRTLEVCDQS